MNNLHKYIRQAVPALIIAAFMVALSTVNWSLQDLFLTLDQQGRVLMAKGDFSAAAKVFQDPIQQGTALYRNGDFKAAAAAFGRGDSADAVYNRSPMYASARAQTPYLKSGSSGGIPGVQR